MTCIITDKTNVVLYDLLIAPNIILCFITHLAMFVNDTYDASKVIGAKIQTFANMITKNMHEISYMRKLNKEYKHKRCCITQSNTAPQTLKHDICSYVNNAYPIKYKTHQNITSEQSCQNTFQTIIINDVFFSQR